MEGCHLEPECLDFGWMKVERDPVISILKRAAGFFNKIGFARGDQRGGCLRRFTPEVALPLAS